MKKRKSKGRKRKRYLFLERAIKRQTGRKVRITSKKPYIACFFIGGPKKTKREQVIAKQVAEEFSNQGSQILIDLKPKVSFIKKERKPIVIVEYKWFVTIRADTLEGLIRKINIVFKKEIYSSMVKRYNELIKSAVELPTELSIVSNKLPIIWN